MDAIGLMVANFNKLKGTYRIWTMSKESSSREVYDNARCLTTS